MFKVLVVEDDTPKLAAITQCLVEAGVKLEDISDARSTQQAKQWLRQNSCDLMILDIKLPRRIDENPRSEGGQELLREIADRDKFSSPSFVIGITQYEEVYAQANPYFEDALVPIVFYESADISWRKRLARKVEDLIASKVSKPTVGNYETDVAIIAALERPELSAVLKLPWDWKEYNDADDDTTYYKANVKASAGERSVVAGAAAFMGMPAAAVLATKMITRFRPRILVVVGITAGIRGKVDLGDVLVADPSWDWGSGKLTLKDGKISFLAAPYQIPLKEEVRGKIRRLANSDSDLAKIRMEWPGEKPNTALKVHLGPVASGATVLSDGNKSTQIEGQHRKIVGIEMEIYGVLAAAELCSKPRPLAVSFKSVCDFADNEKSDAFHAYAAYTSARCMQLFVEKLLT